MKNFRHLIAGWALVLCAGCDQPPAGTNTTTNNQPEEVPTQTAAALPETAPPETTTPPTELADDEAPDTLTEEEVAHTGTAFEDVISDEKVMLEDGLVEEVATVEDEVAEGEAAKELITTEEQNTVLLDSLIPETTYRIAEIKKHDKADVGHEVGVIPIELCREIGEKLGSVDESDCLEQNLKTTEGKSVEGRDLAIKDYLPTDAREPLGRVMVIGGIHGDEFSSVSVVFKWMEILDKYHTGLFHWRFIPASNPDGLLNTKSQRQNANGVDLNRNFPTGDWEESAKDYWVSKAGKQPRRYPGESANSQPETQWLVSQIKEFNPDVIISMHAPYHLVDYDGPPSAPDQLGSLYLRQLGVYPGSLGNYAGVDLHLPIVTVELASAGIMPSNEEISNMWDDLVGWLRAKLDDQPSKANASAL